jgi:hypothetical protein
MKCHIRVMSEAEIMGGLTAVLREIRIRDPSAHDLVWGLDIEAPEVRLGMSDSTVHDTTSRRSAETVVSFVRMLVWRMNQS